MSAPHATTPARDDRSSSSPVRAGLASGSATILRLAAVLAAVALPAAAGAQATAVTPYLSPDHWAVDEVRRLSAAGLAPAGFDASVRSFRIGEVALVFEHAMARATTDARPLADRAAGYRARLGEEFGGWLAGGELRG
ncbi:MAG: hypothetical protein ACRELX_13295, partial [Longimicrobiales bacterium]